MRTDIHDDDEDRDKAPWIAVKIGLPNNHKTMKLAKTLGVSRHEVIGVLVDLWIQGFIHAWQSGDLSKWEPEHVEEMVGYRGEPGRLVGALRAAGFLEPKGLILHDWLRVQKPAIRSRLRRLEERAMSRRPGAPREDQDEMERRSQAAARARKAAVGKA